MVVLKIPKLNLSSDSFKSNKSKLTQPINNKKLYVQALKINIEDIIYIDSINKHLKYVNLNMLANFIYMEKIGIIITTNQITSVQDMSIIEKALKESENVN